MGAAQATQQVPPHVPPELVRAIGITEGAEFLASPFEYMASLQDTLPPIVYNVSEHNRDAWALTKYEDAFYVLRNPDIFSTEGTIPFPRDPNDFWKMIPIEIEAPDHLKYRAILDPMLSPRGVSELEAGMRQLANELIDKFADKGEVEFTTAFGRPLPVGVFLKLVGLPLEMIDTFVGWAMGLLHSLDRAVMQQVMNEITDYLKSQIAEKKAKPDGGAISAIVHGEIDGAPLSEKDIFGYTFFLFIAGLDTVFAALNNIWVMLARRPDVRGQIIANLDDNKKMMAIVEELLRHYTTTFAGRTLTRDIEMRGVQMKKGDRVTCVLPAINFDPGVFENPREVNFDRPRRPTLAFSGGSHMCLGAHLARLEVKVCLQEFLRRIPDFRLKEGTEIVYPPGGVVGPKSVPLVW